jgi:hypothetical protein
MLPPTDTATDAPNTTMAKRSRSIWRWSPLLLLPFAGMLWVPLYNSEAPRLGGVPFFYWYQFAWIGIGAAITAVVYFATREKADEGAKDKTGDKPAP